MKKTYLLVYSGIVGDRERVKEILNQLYMVETWRYDLPNCFYIVSENSAKQISEELRTKFHDKGTFIVTEITSNSFGWLADGAWHLIQNHVHKPK